MRDLYKRGGERSVSLREEMKDTRLANKITRRGCIGT